jgi:disulfide bond formation protein DsbB
MSKHNLFHIITEHHYRVYFLGLITLSSLSILYAFFVEYILGFEPCILCSYQRVPYYLLILIGISGVIYKKYKYSLYMAFTVFLGAALLAGYHTGIERGFFSPSDTCNPGFNIPEGSSADQIRELLYGAPIATCTKAAFKIFALSMTEWNLILNLCCFIGSIWIVKRSR